jgi:signal transduction histidine kinase
VPFGIRRPPVLTLLVAGMLVLLPVLAVLQFRWLGQLSDAERERLQRNLRATTADITTTLNLELARIMVGLQVDGGTLREEAWDRYAERYAAWSAASLDADVVHDILLVDAEGRRQTDPVRVRRWDAPSHTFVHAEWPDGLASLAARIADERRAFAAKAEGPVLRPSEVLTADGSTLVLPVTPIAPLLPDGAPGRLVHVFGFTIVRLDLRTMQTRVLPALVTRHFGPPPASTYHVALVERRGGAVVFEARPGDAAALERGTDVAVDCFGIGPEHFPLMRQAMASLRLPPRSEPRRIFSVFARRPGEPGPQRSGESIERWRLLVRHRAGSLEAAVGVARWRNLTLNFGILLLMSVSVGLIVVAARRAQALARQQMEFVAGVSHELRTPVSVIGAAADNLAQGVVTEAARVKQYGTTIQTEARRLGDTVARVLQFAGIQAGRSSVHRALVSPVEIVGDALAASRATADDAGVTIEQEVPGRLPPIAADRAALQSALENLIGNAVKYGGESGWLRVTAREAETRGGREVQIAVEDRGLGIAPADLPHVFEPFYRGGEAQARQIRGNGLGLSIVRSIVEAHGGHVTVTSAPGKGSTFTIHLPAAQDSSEYGVRNSELVLNSEFGVRK